MKKYIDTIIERLEYMPIDERIEAINEIRAALHEVSPFKNEPIDYVQWVKSDLVHANDYNPNSVAPPEMKLLEHSIGHDGFTQPVVGWPDSDETYEVVDGFHRTTVAKTSDQVRERLSGYIPIVAIKAENRERNHRIASTIRHNRARGKHNVDSMSEIVVELKRRNWSNVRIMRELGMDEDEVLRLCQITGLAELFADQQFSAAWDVQDSITEDDFEELIVDVEEIASVAGDTRVPNTNDENRVFHTYDKWECYRAGFYNSTMPGMKEDEAKQSYADFLSDDCAFDDALNRVITEWKNSCEHYLTNAAMNRIAWLGQASACIALGLPANFRGGWQRLTEPQQNRANELALSALNTWLVRNDMPEVTMEQAMSGGRQADIY